MSTDIKAEAAKLLEKLPEGSTWDDLVHEIYVRQAIESGLEDSKQDRVRDVGEVRKKYGLEP